jgi:ABC-type hemin transport system substrate-binding protein
LKEAGQAAVEGASTKAAELVEQAGVASAESVDDPGREVSL